MALGKIERVYFGSGGYQEAMFGPTFVLETTEGHVNDFWGTWTADPGKDAEWTKDSQIRRQGEMIERLKKLMMDAKVGEFSKLAGIPIEVEWNGMTLKSWRILKEVL